MQKKRRCSVCIQLLIRHTDQGVVPKYIYFQKPKEKKPFYDRLKSSEAFHNEDKQSRYVFHTKLNEEEIPECSIKICDDEFSTHSEFIKLVPNDIFREWNNDNVDKALLFKVGKYQNLWFRELVNANGVKEHAIIHPTPDTKENLEIIEKAFEVEKWLQCKVVILPEEFITMHSINELLLKGAKDTDYYEELEENYEKMDLLEFRASLRSKEAASDRFDKALQNLREDFVHELPIKASSPEYYQKIKRVFDLTILRIFSERGKNGEPLYVVYDDNEETLYFVEIICTKKEDRKTAKQVYERACGMQTNDVAIQMAVRENWIKYQCLHGQDEEFNIFRSLCFAPASGVNERYRIGFMTLTLQLLLCFGITVDSWEKWSDNNLEDAWDDLSSLDYELGEIVIVAISALAFGFILQRLRKTIQSFKRFYRNMEEVCVIPKSISVLDFTSNVIVGVWMAAVTPWLLLKSEDIQTVVLNSFALTIFVELDDLANIFESDEPFLLKEDANGMKRMQEAKRIADALKRLEDPTKRMKDAKKMEDEKKTEDADEMKERRYLSVMEMECKFEEVAEVSQEEKGVPKRQIGGNLTVPQGLGMAAKFIFSPLYETFKITTSLFSLCHYCCCKKEHGTLTGSDSVNQAENQDAQENDEDGKPLHVQVGSRELKVHFADAESEKVKLKVSQSIESKSQEN